MSKVIFLLMALMMDNSQKKIWPAMEGLPENGLLVAHRGLREKHLENTLEALTEAFEIGLDGVEFDVQLSQDLVPFVFHDRHLARLTGVENNIDELLASEIKKLSQISEPYKKIYKIPTLKEVLEQMPKGKLINVELKETVHAQGQAGIKSVLKEMEPFREKLFMVISSFDADLLDQVSKQSQAYPLALLLDQKLKLTDLISFRKIAPKLSFLNPHVSLLNKNISQKIQDKGVKLILWGHKKSGEEELFKAHQHTALISDDCIKLKIQK